jgi:two-component system alkaline phosphatase synthesis response regulator PhoP
VLAALRSPWGIFSSVTRPPKGPAPVKKILVVDDEESILKVVDYALSEAGYEVHTAHDGPGAEFIFEQLRPDLVILDVMLPGKSGLDIAKELRSESNVPIIMLSARGDEVDRILGLEFGADDYVTKPFSPRELVSRVRAILRRVDDSPTERTCIEVGDLSIDTQSRQVRFQGEPLHLTTSEYGILLHLARHPGTAYSRQAILTALWDESPVGDERAIDVHIHNIREKIEADHRNPAYVLTVRGYGYRLREP